MKLQSTSVMAGAALALAGVATVWLAMQIAAAGPGTAAAPAKHESPATIAKVANEADFNTIVLTPEAVERLGIKTQPIERRKVPRSRVFGGEVMIPAGQTILIAAPLGGMLEAPPGGLPPPGQNVKKGQLLITLLPLLTPEARTTLEATRIDAEGLVKNSRTQQEAASIALDRAKRLFREQAGSQRIVDESQAQYDIATRSLEAAQARFDLLDKTLGQLGRGVATPIDSAAPHDGMLRTISVQSGQTVPAGAALFELVDTTQVWIRTPVYVGDQSELNTAADAAVGNLSGAPGQTTWVAHPVVAPPSANALAATIDLFYALDNHKLGLKPGQRVGVRVPLAGEDDNLVAPWSAVVHDAYGGMWVYEQQAPRTYVRRRVTVREVVDPWAVLLQGPPVGTAVVAVGAIELFGTEVGFSK
jgi:RND family efflux transporter MFP subunit